MTFEHKHVDTAATAAESVQDLGAESQLRGRPGTDALLALVPELALYPELTAKIVQAFNSPSRQLEVLITDIDNTLIPGTGNSPVQIRDGLKAAQRLIDFIEPLNVVFIPITGSGWETNTRTTPSVLTRLNSGEIPPYHHALVTDGGMIAVGKDSKGDYQIDPAYQSKVEASKARFNPDGVFAVTSWIIEQLNDPAFAEGQLGLTPLEFDKIAALDPSSPRQRIYLQEHVHPDGTVNGSKVCLYFYANCFDADGHPSLEERDKIEAQFRSEFPSLSTIVCEERDFGNLGERSALEGPRPSKFCLDITPVHKGTPVHYYSNLIKRAADALHAKSGGPEMKIRTWYAGDAANDLVATRFPEVDCVIMVGGSNEEFARSQGELSHSGKTVYRESDPARRGAASILHYLATELLA